MYCFSYSRRGKNYEYLLRITEFLSKDDLNLSILQNSAWLYLEGYRYDGVDSQIAFEMAIRPFKKAGGKIALSLSDPFACSVIGTKFINIINNGVDLVFCNEKRINFINSANRFELCFANE